MYRMIYKSRSTEQMSLDLIRSIAIPSEARNEQAGLTGVLLATQTHYLQVIEGTFEEVNRVFQRIVKDERHFDFTLIAFSVIDARLFGGWGMRGIGVFDLNSKLELALKKKYGEEDGGIRFPLEEWAALAFISDIKMMRELPEWKR